MDDQKSSYRYKFEKSRTGEIVPAVCLPQSCQPLHSLIDPKHEARRLIAATVPPDSEDTGFLIFLGIGGGFLPEAALERTNSYVLVIDFGYNSIQELFSNKDYSAILNNNRFNILIDPSHDDIKSFILEHYKPALYGGIKTIPLRTRVEIDKPLFELAIKSIQEAIELVSGDYSVQAHFGKRWFSNIIRNIKEIETVKENFFTEKKDFSVNEAAIIAAGPSLDVQLPSLVKLKSRGCFIISSDTALPSLLRNGIEPDVIVSIDCQHISYYHFLHIHSNIRHIPLILDIASPPLLSGFSSAPAFFSGGHPLAMYIASQKSRTFPFLDTSGANVTYACLSLAEYLKAKHITLFGADFSYINCQTYARGTYILPYFTKKQNRFSPIEGQHSTFLYRSPFLEQENGKKTNYYETSSLYFYRKKLEEKISMMTALIKQEPGLGSTVRINREQLTINNEQKTTDNKQMGIFNGKEFLEKYRNDIATLPLAARKENYLKQLDLKQTRIFTTLLPYMAAIKKRNNELKQHDLIEEVKKCCITEIERVLT